MATDEGSAIVMMMMMVRWPSGSGAAIIIIIVRHRRGVADSLDTFWLVPGAATAVCVCVCFGSDDVRISDLYIRTTIVPYRAPTNKNEDDVIVEISTS